MVDVWEWVQDLWHDNYEGAPNDGSAWETGDNERRVLRGGSRNSKPWRVRSACRNWRNRDGRGNDIGFRLAKDL
jgi:formylglycine-generating enzyme required for sulfatase activity